MTTLDNVETGLEEAEKILPELTPFLSMIPGLNMVAPFLSLLPVLIEAVQTIQKATGASQAGAITAVRSHLTPGFPNSPSLGVNAVPSQGGANTGS